MPAFCSGLIESFEDRRKELFTPAELQQGLFHGERPNRDGKCVVPLMALSIGVAHTQIPAL